MFPVRRLGEAPPLHRSISLGDSAAQWLVPEETPVAFVYNRRNYAVMLATPSDLADFAAGFSLTEETAASLDEILSLDIHYTERGADLRISLADAALERFDLRRQRRSIAGVSGCGLCGLESADRLFEPLPASNATPMDVSLAAVNRAMDALRVRQPLNERTRSVHAAAWVGPDGDIAFVREDVGRHNALDKLLGALALGGGDPAAGFVLMSSRCSFELVDKAARRGVRALASLSAPTGFAIDRARQARVALFAQGDDGALRIDSAG